jgi:hypothetical protein
MPRARVRHHLGTGALASRRERSVFVNCPFDPKFRPTFDAIVFSAICCGFLPRSAIESGSVAVPRMERIVGPLRASKYSLHDLSRCQGEGDANLARFNMPLELGIAMAESTAKPKSKDRHDWLVLVPRGHPYKQFVSDLAGYDPPEYDGSPESVVPSVMSWLATRPDAVQCPMPQEVLTSFPDLHVAFTELLEKWYGQVPWADLVMEAIRVGSESGLIPTASALSSSAHIAEP